VSLDRLHLRLHPRESLTRLLLAALLTLPFLYPLHYRPIASFWAEWWAAAFGLMLATLVLWRGPVQGNAIQKNLPGIAMLVLVLAVSLGLHFLWGRIHVTELGLLRLAYLAWAALLATAGWQLAQDHGQEWLADAATPPLLAGALLNALLILLQAGSVSLPAQIMFHHPQALFGGNLAQPNHANHHLWLGLVSVIYLYSTRRNKAWLLVPAALLLAAASALTASRSSLLYAPMLVCLAWTAQASATQGDCWSRLRRATTLISVLSVTFLVLHHLAISQGLLPHIAAQTGIERFFQDGGGMASRFAIWRRAWEIFLSHPWFGAGVGELPWENFQTVPQLALHGDMVVVEHSHNLLLQLFAESGLVVTLLCGILLWRWWRGLSLYAASPARWWAGAVIAIAAMHSLLEYPLWYAYFLGPAALLLGACDRGIAIPHLPLSLRRTAIPFIALAGAVFLWQVRGDFSVVEKRINPWLASPVVELPASLAAPDLSAVRGSSLFSPYIDFAVTTQMALDTYGIEEKMRTCARTMRFYPQASIAFKCALVDALGGRMAQARAGWQYASQAYPAVLPEQLEMLAALAQRHPELESLKSN
jgi:O-antigen ligase